jgi:hypothetical protein
VAATPHWNDVSQVYFRALRFKIRYESTAKKKAVPGTGQPGSGQRKCSDCGSNGPKA